MWKTEKYIGSANRSSAGACKVGEAKYAFSTRKKIMHSWSLKGQAAPDAADQLQATEAATA